MFARAASARVSLNTLQIAWVGTGINVTQDKRLEFRVSLDDDCKLSNGRPVARKQNYNGFGVAFRDETVITSRRELLGRDMQCLPRLEVFEFLRKSEFVIFGARLTTREC